MEEITGIVKACKDCGESFGIPYEHAEWFKEKGLKIPARCPSCRNKKRKRPKKSENFEEIREALRNQRRHIDACRIQMIEKLQVEREPRAENIISSCIEQLEEMDAFLISMQATVKQEESK